MNYIFRRSSTVRNPTNNTQEIEELNKLLKEKNDQLLNLEKILNNEMKTNKKLQDDNLETKKQLELKKESSQLLQDENRALKEEIKLLVQENSNLTNIVTELKGKIESQKMQVQSEQKSPKSSLFKLHEFSQDNTKSPGLYEILQMNNKTPLNNNPLLKTQFLDLAYNQVQQENIFLSQDCLQSALQFHSQFLAKNVDEEFHNHLQMIKSDSQKEKCRLFEAFYIFGFSNEELKEKLNNSPDLSSAYFNPSIQFEYYSNQNDKKINKKMLESCSQVFGHQIQEIINEDQTQQEMILDIIIGLSNEQNLKERFHLFTYNEKIQQDFENQQLIDIYNPYRQLYGLCMTVEDFLIINNQVFKYFKTFCFITYFPIIELFQKLLINIINQQKIIRNNEIKPEAQFLKIDGFNLIKNYSDTFTQILDILRRVKPQPCNYSIEIQLKWHNVNYFMKKHYSKIRFTFPQIEQIELQSNIWCTSIVLQIFEVKEILLIFFTILLEKKVVFISEKSSKISATIQYFLYMIKPLRWSSILCYNLFNQGQSMINTLNKNSPMIIGLCLNQGESNLSDFQEKLNQISQDLVLIYLDRNSQKIVFQDYKQQCQIINSYPDTRIFYSLKKYGETPKNNRIFYETNEKGEKYIQEYLLKLSQIKQHFLAVLPNKEKVVSEVFIFNYQQKREIYLINISFKIK